MERLLEKLPAAIRQTEKKNITKLNLIFCYIFEKFIQGIDLYPGSSSVCQCRMLTFVVF